MEKASTMFKDNRNTSVNELINTRNGRRKSLQTIIQQLEQIKAAEEKYLSNIPDNLCGSVRYENAEQCISDIEEAIDILNVAY